MIKSHFKSHRGRLPIVYAVVDLTCLEKTGKYKGLEEFVRTYNGKYGVHVALLYLSIGLFRFQHFVVATETLSGAYIVRLGKRRWAIEACFKALKQGISSKVRI